MHKKMFNHLLIVVQENKYKKCMWILKHFNIRLKNQLLNVRKKQVSEVQLDPKFPTTKK